MNTSKPVVYYNILTSSQYFIKYSEHFLQFFILCRGAVKERDPHSSSKAIFLFSDLQRTSCSRLFVGKQAYLCSVDRFVVFFFRLSKLLLYALKMRKKIRVLAVYRVFYRCLLHGDTY